MKIIPHKNYLLYGAYHVMHKLCIGSANVINGMLTGTHAWITQK